MCNRTIIDLLSGRKHGEVWNGLTLHEKSKPMWNRTIQTNIRFDLT